MNRVWTEEELDILRRDREAKVPVPVTAAKLGSPVPATYARARLIGTLVQPHQSWDEASVARLRELVCADPPMTDKRIAAELGRTVTQIRWKMQDLGLIGVRDLSKLAKITAAETARPKAVKPQSDKPAPARPTPRMQPTQPPAASRARACSPDGPRGAANRAAEARSSGDARRRTRSSGIPPCRAAEERRCRVGSRNDPRRPRGHRREGAHRSAARHPRQARGRGRRAMRSGSQGSGGGSQAPGGRGEESRSRGRPQSRRGCAPGTGRESPRGKGADRRCQAGRKAQGSGAAHRCGETQTRREKGCAARGSGHLADRDPAPCASAGAPFNAEDRRHRGACGRAFRRAGIRFRSDLGPRRLEIGSAGSGPHPRAGKGEGQAREPCGCDRSRSGGSERHRALHCGARRDTQRESAASRR